MPQAAATVVTESETIPNNHVASTASPAKMPLDNYKNNILKAKSQDENKKVGGNAMLSFSTSTSTPVTDEKSSTNLNIHGESPPPKEVPDMSSATFVSVGGDKLTLNLGNSSPEMKLINLDTSPTSKVAPPPPPPRTTSDPHYNKNENSNENNNDTSIPVSVTYFSSGLNGHGLERETIFADDHAATDAASIVRQHLNPFNSGSSKNPFLDSNGQVPSDHKDDKDKSLDDLVEQKNPRSDQCQSVQ